MQEDRAPSSADGLLGIGERLRNAREAKGLTLAVAETLTRIRATYLSALEEEQFARLPGAVYARGYLRTYALALGLDPDDLMEAYPGAFSRSHEPIFTRSEEHTSELQSQSNLVCRLLLEKKKTHHHHNTTAHLTSHVL